MPTTHQCPRCNPALAGLWSLPTNHILNNCNHDKSFASNPLMLEKLWPSVTNMGINKDEPGDLRQSDLLLKTFQSHLIDSEFKHNGFKLSKHLLENAFGKVFTKKGVNQAEVQATKAASGPRPSGRTLPTRSAPSTAGSSEAGSSTATTSKGSASAAASSKAGPSTAAMSTAGKSQQGTLFEPTADMILPEATKVDQYQGPLTAASMNRYSTRRQPTQRDGELAPRPGFADESPSKYVLTNHFALTVNTGIRLYQYSIAGTKFDEVKERPKRKAYIERLIAKYSTLADRKQHFVTDFDKYILSWQELSDSPLIIGGLLVDGTVEEYRRGEIGQVGDVDIQVQFNRVTNLQDLVDFVSGRNIDYDEHNALRALNLLFSKGRGSDSFEISQRKLFYKPGWSSLGADTGLIAVRNYAYSVRPGMGALLLNINLGMSSFHAPMYVNEYISILNTDNHWWVEKNLRGLRVRIMYRRGKTANDEMDSEARRTRTITGVSKYHADKQTFTRGEGAAAETVSVWDHINETYPGVAECGPTQWCIDVGDPANNKHTWFLSEHLYILPNQPYKRKLDPDLSAAMITVACRAPEVNRNAIMKEGLPAIGIRETGPLPTALGSSGISIDKRMLEVPARVINQPTVVYASGNLQANQGKWSTRSVKYIDQATFGNQKFIRFMRPEGNLLNRHWLDVYKKGFVNIMTANGIGNIELRKIDREWYEVPNAYWSDVQALGNELRQQFQAPKNIGLFVLILPDNSSAWQPCYAAFKVAADQIAGVPSLVICEKKMLGSIKDFEEKVNITPGNLGGYFGNMSMKLNVRLGHGNHTVDGGFDILKTGNTLDTMVLGVDVTHPGTGCADGTPSIAAVVGSIDADMAKYRGAMRYQEKSNEEIVVHMEDMVKDLLRVWKGKNGGRLPARILCYRDGVGESQYRAVRQAEVNAIRNAWRTMHGAAQPAKPLQLTFVLVTKRHNTRFFPSPTGGGGRLGNGNCLPGTVVESGITSPYYFDFFLQSQNGLVGTARPTHYIVLENGMEFSAKELQDLTNAICYTYARSTTAVSYATPAYYADHLCERGKQYLKPLFDGDEAYDGMSEAQVATVVERMWNRGGRVGGNPWNARLDDSMFWI
jgi:eukaryotic translation initiation factor 2C